MGCCVRVLHFGLPVERAEGQQADSSQKQDQAETGAQNICRASAAANEGVDEEEDATPPEASGNDHACDDNLTVRPIVHIQRHESPQCRRASYREDTRNRRRWEEIFFENQERGEGGSPREILSIDKYGNE